MPKNMPKLQKLISKINASSSSVSSTTTVPVPDPSTASEHEESVSDAEKQKGGRRNKKTKRRKTKKKMASWKIAQDKFKKKSLRTNCGNAEANIQQKKHAQKNVILLIWEVVVLIAIQRKILNGAKRPRNRVKLKDDN